MMKYDTMFHVSLGDLEDGIEKTFDVYYSTPYGQELVAEPVTRKHAEAIAHCLNLVRDSLLDCESDNSVQWLEYQIETAIKKHKESGR